MKVQDIGWRIVLYLMWTLETIMQRDIANKVFAKLSGETMFFHSNKFGGSLVSQNSKLSSCVERFWGELVWAVLPLVISLTGSIVILSMLLWQYALFLFMFSIRSA